MLRVYCSISYNTYTKQHSIDFVKRIFIFMRIWMLIIICILYVCVCVCVCSCKSMGKELERCMINWYWLITKNQECVIIGVSREIITLSQSFVFFLIVNFWVLFEDGYVNVTSCN